MCVLGRLFGSATWIAGLLMAVSPAWGQSTGAASSARPDSLDAMRLTVEQASRHSVNWEGPVTGPPGQANKTVAIIAEDLRNGGIVGVSKGLQEAAEALAWHLKVFDAGGSPDGRLKALAAALASNPDGVALIGMDAKEIGAQLGAFAQRGIPMVGWHVGPVAGPMAGSPIAMNVSTNPLDVARIAAMAAVVQSHAKANAVIFTDGNFEIAKAKAQAMADIIRACKTCKLLEIRDVAISKSAQTIPKVTRELLQKYGDRWNSALAINDIYFDYAAPQLTSEGRASSGLHMLSAGDGSMAAFLRIEADVFQTGTVAEPLNLHGWQLLDELNRLFAHQAVTGYILPVHLVTSENIKFDGGDKQKYDPDNNYRMIYKKIWAR